MRCVYHACPDFLVPQYLLHRNLTDAAEALGIDCAKAGLPMVDDTIEPRFTSTPEALQIAVSSF